MNAEDLVAALDLPSGSRVDQRVPKRLLLEHAPTAVDRRRIAEGIDEVQWLAALKPATVGVPVFRDDEREYLEIAVLTAALRERAKASRLAELIHRAIPYPVLLVTEHDEFTSLSLAHKRWSQGEVGTTVLDQGVVSINIIVRESSTPVLAFRDALALSRQPRTHLYAVYQGWIEVATAFLAAQVTGAFAAPASPAQAAAREEALRECARLDTEIARLRSAAAKERQVPRQVELNLELKRAERERAAAAERL